MTVNGNIYRDTTHLLQVGQCVSTQLILVVVVTEI
jgi:hypothetical protein